jgi:hypothetical protein
MNFAPIFGDPIEGYLHQYGFNWRKGTHQIAIELAMFREKITKRIPADTGAVDTFHHFQRIAKAFWPERDSKATVNFIWHPWAERMIRAACNHEYLAIAGSGGCGKS